MLRPSNKWTPGPVQAYLWPTSFTDQPTGHFHKPQLINCNGQKWQLAYLHTGFLACGTTAIKLKDQEEGSKTVSRLYPKMLNQDSKLKIFCNLRE